MICDGALSVRGKNAWGIEIVCGGWVGLNEWDFVPENVYGQMEFGFGAWPRLKCASRKIYWIFIFIHPLFHFLDSSSNFVFCVFFPLCFILDLFFEPFFKQLCLYMSWLHVFFFKIQAQIEVSPVYTYRSAIELPQAQVAEHCSLDHMKSSILL